MTGDVDLAKLQRTAVQALQAYTYPSWTDSEKEDERGMSFRLRIEGPLFNGEPISITSLRVEVSKRELVLLPANRDEIAPPYTDVMPYVLGSMDLEEVLAEKVRTLATRSKARDLYDVCQLTRLGVTVDRDLVDKKMKWGDQTIDKEDILERAKYIGSVWDKELRSLIEHVPPFDEALSALEHLLEDLEGTK
jgi:predicted nucleotidyltransferase component of viral defense system